MPTYLLSRPRLAMLLAWTAVAPLQGQSEVEAIVHAWKWRKVGEQSTTAPSLPWPRVLTGESRERSHVEVFITTFLRLHAVVSGAELQRAVQRTSADGAGRAANGDKARPATDGALWRYVTSDGSWCWIEDKNEEFFHESSGSASNYYDWDSLTLEPQAVSLYSKDPSLVGAWCKDCGIRITRGSYTIRSGELTLRSGTVQLIRLERAVATGTATPRVIAELTVAFERRGAVLDAQGGLLVIKWADGTQARFRRLQLPR